MFSIAYLDSNKNRSYIYFIGIYASEHKKNQVRGSNSIIIIIKKRLSFFGSLNY